VVSTGSVATNRPGAWQSAAIDAMKGAAAAKAHANCISVFDLECGQFIARANFSQSLPACLRRVFNLRSKEPLKKYLSEANKSLRGLKPAFILLPLRHD
jgi:hypothetical protein